MHVIQPDISTSRCGCLSMEPGPRDILLDPCLIRSREASGQLVVRLGIPLVDRHAERDQYGIPLWVTPRVRIHHQDSRGRVEVVGGVDAPPVELVRVGLDLDRAGQGVCRPGPVSTVRSNVLPGSLEHAMFASSSRAVAVACPVPEPANYHSLDATTEHASYTTWRDLTHGPFWP